MKNKIIIICCFLIMFFCFTGCGASETVFVSDDNKESQSEKLEEDDLQNENTKEDSIDESRAIEENNSVIVVYVCGAVYSPGVYEIASESRIIDAVNAAGGLTENAQAEGINLADTVSDGEQIRVPFIGEENVVENNIDEHKANSQKININTATKEELMTLSGVGESKADAIINYRENIGKFKSVEEIMNIEGIKEGVFNKIKDNICI